MHTAAELDVRFFRVRENVHSDSILEDMRKKNLRPFSAKELLTFKRRNRGKYLNVPLVALGSVLTNDQGVKQVLFLAGSRIHGIVEKKTTYDRTWGSDWLFAVHAAS